MHYYTATTSEMLKDAQGQSQDPEAYMWKRYFPQMAFNNRLVLYAMLGASAYHVRSFAAFESENLHEKYMDKAFKQHRQLLAQQNRCHEDAEALLASGLLIMQSTWCCFNHAGRSGVFNLPFQTWHIARGLEYLFHTLENLVCSNTRQLFGTPRRVVPFDGINQSNPFLESAHADLRLFLERLRNESTVSETDLVVYEHCAQKLRNLYNMAVAYDPNQQYTFYRAVFLMPIWEPPLYLSLLSRKAPPALAVLARAWCLLRCIKTLWWNPDTEDMGIAEYGLEGIAGMLPKEWHWSVEWPMQVLSGHICINEQ